MTLSGFLQGELPQIGANVPLTEVSSYGQLAYWIEEMARQCLEKYATRNETDVGGYENEVVSLPGASTERRKRDKEVGFRTDVGYAITGQGNGVGVFLWASGSVFDGRFVNHH